MGKGLTIAFIFLFGFSADYIYNTYLIVQKPIESHKEGGEGNSAEENAPVSGEKQHGEEDEYMYDDYGTEGDYGNDYAGEDYENQDVIITEGKSDPSKRSKTQSDEFEWLRVHIQLW
jgi:hypothetical protein